MTNEQRDVFAHALRGLSQITAPDDTAGLMIDPDLRCMNPSDKTRKRWIIHDDKLPTEYETGETADKTTVNMINSWLLLHAVRLCTNLNSALYRLNRDHRLHEDKIYYALRRTND